MPTIACRKLIAGIGLTLLLAAGGSSASAAALDDLINRLDSEDLITRDTATDELRGMLSDASDPQKAELSRSFEMEAAEALRSRDLTLEQRVRLYDALRDRFFNSPRGAMGVQFVQPQIQPHGVELGQVFPGFPAGDQGLLKAGDFVTAVAGVSLLNPDMAQIGPTGMPRGSDMLRRIVISHDPGEVVELTVVRLLPTQAGQPNAIVRQGDVVNRIQIGGGAFITEGPAKNAEIVTVGVPLGSFNSLRNGNFMDPNTLEGAWRQRAERLGIPEPATRTLETPLTLREWMSHRRMADQSGPALLAGEAQDGAREMRHAALAEAGIEARQLDLRQVPAPIEERMQRLARQARARANNVEFRKGGDALLQPQPQPQAAGGPEEIMSMFQTLAALNRQRDSLLAQAADPTVPEKQQRAASAEAAQLQEFINRMSVVLQRKLIENAKAQPNNPEKK